MTEGRATGIPKILFEVKQNGSPLPEFEADEDRLTFLTRFPIHPDTPEDAKLGAESQPESNDEKPESRPESRAESPEQQLRERLLNTLSKEPLGKSEISTKLGQKAVSGSLNQLIRQLIKEGVIEMTIPEKPNSRLQKYRLVLPQ